MHTTATEVVLASNPLKKCAPAPPWFPSLRERRPQQEIMDHPELDAAQHLRALRGLERIHAITGGARYFWRSIEALAQEGGAQPLRVLDMATGGGGIPIALWRRAQRAGIAVEVSGCDISGRAVAYAREHADRAQAAVRFFEHDVLRDGVPGGFDVVICSLFLHHLIDEQASALLAQVSQCATRMAMVLDIVRNAPGYALAYWGPRLITPSGVVHVDAPLSVLSAFRLQDVDALARSAALTHYRIEKRFPFRFLLTWRRP